MRQVTLRPRRSARHSLATPGIALDWDHPFYNFSLTRHQARGDLVEEPGRVWGIGVGRPFGICAHLMELVRSGGDCSFTHILVVLDSTDYARVASDWHQEAERTVQNALETLQAKLPTHVGPRGDRPVRLVVARDGGERIGVDLDLRPSEYVTALLPNLYNPGDEEQPTHRVFVQLPGDDAPTEVASIYPGQLLYTLGPHWLDTALVPAIPVPAAYQIEIREGQLFHGLNPNATGRLQLYQSGSATSTIARADGTPLAWVTIEATGGALVRPRKLPRQLAFQETGVMLVSPANDERIEYYDIELGPSAELGHRLPEMAAAVRVHPGGVELHIATDGVGLDDTPDPKGGPHLLEDTTSIDLGNERVIFEPPPSDTPGFPYLGLLRRPGRAAYFTWDQVYRVGRDTRSDLRLPEATHVDAIRWRPGSSQGAPRRAAPLVSLEGAEAILKVRGDRPVARCSAEHHHVYVRRGGELIILHADESDKDHQLTLDPGDELIIGSGLYTVVYPNPTAVDPPDPPPFTWQGEVGMGRSLTRLHHAISAYRDSVHRAVEPSGDWSKARQSLADVLAAVDQIAASVDQRTRLDRVPGR